MGWKIAVFVIFILLFCASPVHFAVCLRVSETAHFGFGFSFLLPEAAVRMAEKRAEAESVRGARRGKLRLHRKKHPFTLRSFPPIFKLIGGILKHTRLERLRADGVLRTGNAASTALLWGAAQSAGCAVQSANCVAQSVGYATEPARSADGMTEIRIIPDFSIGHSDLTVLGMVSVRAGHIIAVLILHPKELFELWKSTRLKAS